MHQTESELEWWFQSQMLCQEDAMDCGVRVFGELTNLSREEILFDMPDAVKGKTVDQWEAYVNGKGWGMVRHQPDEEHPQPCAHLHRIIPGYHHWIFEAEDGGISDSDPSCQHCPPKMLELSSYNVILTVTLKRLTN
jgi:hypothetical protein